MNSHIPESCGECDPFESLKQTEEKPLEDIVVWNYGLHMKLPTAHWSNPKAICEQVGTDGCDEAGWDLVRN